MNDDTIDTVWLECPACRWRREYPQTALSGSMRCRMCGSTVLVSAPAFEPAIKPEDELSLEPVDLPPVSGVNEVIAVEPEYQLAPSTPTAPPTDIASKVLPGSARVETESDDVVRPPRSAGIGWAFTSNVLLFPWTPSAVVKWVWASLFSIMATCVGVLTAPIASRYLSINSLVAPILIVPAILLALLSLSYLCACLIDITVNAAYNCDRANDWPEAEMKERFWFFLRVAYLLVIASMPAVLLAEIAWHTAEIFWPVYTAVMFLLFPVFLLSALETDSAVTPISRPIFRSLWIERKSWFAFYFFCALLLGAFSGIAYFTAASLGTVSGLLLGPLEAAMIFIYGRLLGRLAWLILRNDELAEAATTDHPNQATMPRLGRRRDRQARQLFRGLP